MDNATIALLVTAVGTAIGTAAAVGGAMWKLSRDNRQTLQVMAEQHKNEQENRAATAAALKLEREHEADIARGKFDNTVRDLTVALTSAIEAAKVFTAARADAAYKEANNVNRKIETLHTANETQQQILRDVLSRVSSDAPPARDASARTRSGDAPPVVIDTAPLPLPATPPAASPILGAGLMPEAPKS